MIQSNAMLRSTATILFLLLLNSISYTQSVSIPDDAFKNCLLENTELNLDGDQEISLEEAQSFEGEITCMDLGISDLTGIEEFILLKFLNVSNNDLTSLDVSTCEKLRELECNFNKLTHLEINRTIYLNTLRCRNNQLQELDLFGTNNLSNLTCSDNLLTKLKLPYSRGLETISCGNNQLTELDFSANPRLYFVSCPDNQLTHLDCSKNRHLTSIRCSDNNLRQLDFATGSNENVVFFHAAGNEELECIKIDEGIDPEILNSYWVKDSLTVYSEDCSPCDLIIDDWTTNATECNDDTGSLEFTIQGGVGPYKYYLNEEEILSLSIENLKSGSYKLKVVDSQGCSDVVFPTIFVNNYRLEFSDPTFDEVQFPGYLGYEGHICQGDSLTVTVVGAGENAIYFWSNGSNEQSIKIATGDYNLLFSVLIIETAGCQSGLSIIANSGPAIANVVTEEPNCNANDGVIVLNNPRYLGYKPITYELNGVISYFSRFDSLPPGKYLGSIYDGLGCRMDTTIILQESTDGISMDSINYIGCSGDGYSIIINEVQYDETNPIGIETLTSTLGCDSLISVNLEFLPEDDPNCIINSIQEKDFRNVVIYPNPANEFLNVSSNNSIIKSWEIFSTVGELIKSNSSIYTSDFTIPIEFLTDGVYVLKSKTEVGVFIEKFSVYR